MFIFCVRVVLYVMWFDVLHSNLSSDRFHAHVVSRNDAEISISIYLSTYKCNLPHKYICENWAHECELCSMLDSTILNRCSHAQFTSFSGIAHLLYMHTYTYMCNISVGSILFWYLFDGSLVQFAIILSIQCVINCIFILVVCQSIFTHDL